MTTIINRPILSAVLFSFASSAVGWAQSAWLPAQGEFIATPGAAFSTFDEFWIGRTRVRNPPNGKSLDQYTGFVTLEYGILRQLAADVTIGYTATDTDAFGGASDDGLADTQLGLRYRLVDETRALPSLALRLGGIVAGTYDENAPFSAGDGASGFEASLLLGKTFGDSGFGAYGDIGYRIRESDVPDDLFGSVGLFKQFQGVFRESDAFTLSVGYRHVQGLSGPDIGAPGFGTSFGFPQVREINQLLEGSVGYSDSGGRQYQFTVAKSVEGRNTGDKMAFVVTISLPFAGTR
jgi:hypothetical protein